MHIYCEFKDQGGNVDGIMCGTNTESCLSNEWCSGQSNEKQSYWSNDTYQNGLCTRGKLQSIKILIFTIDKIKAWK